MVVRLNNELPIRVGDPDDGADRLLPSQMEELAEMVERDISSRQPRFTSSDEFFFSTLEWVGSFEEAEVDYSPKNRARDTWLAGVWQDEPHLAGVLDSAILIHANRGWSMTGGRNQVYRAVASAHNWGCFPGLTGWRPGMKLAAQSFYSTDLNCVLEIQREGRRGPWRGFVHADPTRCQLNGNPTKPLTYYPRGGRRVQKWPEDDYVRIASMPFLREEYHGLGFCAISRCIELAKIMLAVYQHELESLGAKAPKGLLLLQGISQSQWKTAMQVRKENLSALEREYYGGVAVLATSGIGEVNGRLIALSTLPQGFDLKTFTDLLMFGYALCFGFDPSEFWPVQFGSLGRGLEAQVQHQKATGKGGLSFTLELQEALQKLLPPSVHFEFDQRDDAGDLARASVVQAWATIADTLYGGGMGVMQDREQVLSLLAQNGVIPPEYTEIMEDTVVTDIEQTRNHPRVLRACERYSKEPIIRYCWPTGREQVLWESGSDAFKKRTWQISSSDIMRAISV
jgi:hypothetical protein